MLAPAALSATHSSNLIWRAVAYGLGLVVIAGAVGLYKPIDARASSSTTTTASSSPMTVPQWKQQYEPAVGVIADDILVVVDTGVKDAKHPTKNKAKLLVSACNTWHKDAEDVPGKAPPIPMASAEASWQRLISASLSASSDCVAALERGVKSAAIAFPKQLAKVQTYEGQLTSELGTTTG